MTWVWYWSGALNYPVKCIHLSLLLSLWPFVSLCWHSCQCLPLCCPLAGTLPRDMLNNSAVAIQELTIQALRMCLALCSLPPVTFFFFVLINKTLIIPLKWYKCLLPYSPLTNPHDLCISSGSILSLYPQDPVAQSRNITCDVQF